MAHENEEHMYAKSQFPYSQPFGKNKIKNLNCGHVIKIVS